MPIENNTVAIIVEAFSVRIRILPLASTKKEAAMVTAKSRMFAAHK
jgi:hypothetical protein